MKHRGVRIAISEKNSNKNIPVALKPNVKLKLDGLKIADGETYNSVVDRLANFYSRPCIRDDQYAVKLKSPGLSTPDYSSFELTEEQYNAITQLLLDWGFDFNHDCVDGF